MLSLNTSDQANLETDWNTQEGENFSYDRFLLKSDKLKELERTKMELLATFIENQLRHLAEVPKLIISAMQETKKLQRTVFKLQSASELIAPSVRIDVRKLTALLHMKININTAIKKADDLLNVSRKLEEIVRIASDEANFVIAQQRFEDILTLERAMKQANIDSQVFLKFEKQFQEVHNFRKTFLSNILSVFEKYQKYAKDKPEVLKNAIDVIEMNDALEQTSTYKRLMLSQLDQTVKNRFKDQLSGKTEIHTIVQSITFCVDDLNEISELVEPLFPKRYNIFESFKTFYKEQIEHWVLPFLKDLSSLKESPGDLVYLFNWSVGYERLLQKEGFFLADFDCLREEIKKCMPIFFDHLSNFVRSFLNNVFKGSYGAFLIEQETNEFRTLAPEDLARCVNELLNTLHSQIQGEVLYQSLFAIIYSLKEFFNRKVA